MRLIIFAVVLLATSSLLAQEDAPANLHLRLAEAQSHVLAEAERAASSASKIAGMLKVADAARQQAGSYDDAQVNEIIIGFPGLFVLDINALETPTGVQTDAAIIELALKKSLATLKSRDMLKCFDDGSMSFRSTATCKSLLEEHCASYGSSDRKLVATELSSTLEMAEVTINSRSDLDAVRENGTSGSRQEPPPSLQPYFDAMQERQYCFCRLAAASGFPFRPKTPADYTIDSPNLRGLYYTPRTLEDLTTECFDLEVLTTARNLYLAEIVFPAFGNWKFWKPAVEKRVAECRKGVQQECENAYLLDQQVILGYVTKGCEIREVVAADIDEDIQRFAALGMTHADRLKHAQLKDTIAICKAASDAGFMWRYSEPSLAHCRKPSPAKPRAKKKPPA